jgi:hypothetical protein
MATRTASGEKLYNATPELAAAFVEVMHKYQALGLDIEMLRCHLASIEENPDVGARVLACILSAAVVVEKLVQAQIIALGRE